MDSSLAYLSFDFIKKFDHFLPLILNNSYPIAEGLKQSNL